MNRHARRRAQRWIWEIVDALEPTRNYLVILPPPSDADAGAPRGEGELTLCLRAAGLQPDSLAVVDGWRVYNRSDWLGEVGCAEPKRVNRRAGEIVNRDGLAANHIENKWSNVSDRAEWGGV